VAYSKAERLEIFMDRLARAAATASAEEAYALVATTLNEVENEFSSTPFDPDNWKTDGRLYPPQEDNKRLVMGHPDVTRYRTVAHNVFIGANGAIEIQTVRGTVLFQKPGADGRSLWQI
jgi:hypothetical protein